MKLYMVARAFLLVLIVVGSTIGYRYYIYHHESDLRAGMSAFKSGDYSLAHQKFQKYSNKNKLAQEMMGRLSAFGLHGDVNFAEAMQWFSTASSTDSELANYAYYVGLDYIEPDGLVRIDNKKAKYWMQLASDLGHADAIKYLQSEITN